MNEETKTVIAFLKCLLNCKQILNNSGGAIVEPHVDELISEYIGKFESGDLRVNQIGVIEKEIKEGKHRRVYEDPSNTGLPELNVESAPAILPFLRSLEEKEE